MNGKLHSRLMQYVAIVYIPIMKTEKYSKNDVSPSINEIGSIGKNKGLEWRNYC